MSTQELLHSRVNAVKARLHYASKRILNQQRRNEVKQWLISRRKQWAGIYVLMHGRYTAKDLVDQIRTRITNDFDILMVHSAYDRLLPMYSGKSQEILHELMDLCGKERTLAMPAFVLGGRTYNVSEFYRTRNFDARRTPSEMGLLTEMFRRVPGVARSLHPTHSICALGPLSGQLTANHHFSSTRTGKDTPFETMASKRTIIVGFGVEYYRCLTQMHTAEDMLGDSFPIKFARKGIPVTIIDEKARRFVYDLTVLKTSRPMNNGILRSLLTDAELQEWTYKGTPLFMTFAEKVSNRLIQAAKRGVTIYGSNN